MAPYGRNRRSGARMGYQRQEVEELHKTVIAAAALLALVGLSPVGSVAALHVPPTLNVHSGATQMVEGQVLSISGSSFVMLSPSERTYCPPGAMCPLVIRAPERYYVQAQGAKVFGNYLGTLSLKDLRKGMDVVVYGTVSNLPRTGNAYSAPLPEPFVNFSASGVFVVGTNNSVVSCSGSSSSCSPGTYMPQTGTNSAGK